MLGFRETVFDNKTAKIKIQDRAIKSNQNFVKIKVHVTYLIIFQYIIL